MAPWLHEFLAMNSAHKPDRTRLGLLGITSTLRNDNELLYLVSDS